MSITINGNKITEYEDPHDETQHDYPKKTVLRYIEASSGTYYTILNEVSSEYKLKSSLALIIQIDAWKTLTNPLFVRSESNDVWTYDVDGKEVVDNKGRQWKQPFKFSPLKIGNAEMATGNGYV